MNLGRLPDSLGLVELTIPSKPEWVAVARLAVAAVASRLRFSVDDIEDVKLAIAEACTVSIEHAESDPAADDHAIEIVCEAGEQALRIVVRDGFVSSNDLGELGDDGEQSEKLGVFLIRALMDSVEVNSEPGTGLELVMTKLVSK